MLSLAGCAIPFPKKFPEESSTPKAWNAPIPHGGNPGSIGNWWATFDDSLLPELIDAAQLVNPDVTMALANIERSQARVVSAEARWTPTAELQMGGTRGRSFPGIPVATTQQGVLKLAWEVDLFNSVGSSVLLEKARRDGAQANWHEARVLLAAEVANTYIGLRSCELRVDLLDVDTRSRDDSAQIAERAVAAGVQPPAHAALAKAGAAQSRASLLHQRNTCESLVKALVSLTALDETQLKGRLGGKRGRIPQPEVLSVSAVPAVVLQQRPDIAAAAANVYASGALIDIAYSQRYPRISLSGEIGAGRVSSTWFNDSGMTWSLGPVSVVIPIFLQQAVDGYRASLNAVEQRLHEGMASQFELEDARRSHIAAQLALADCQHERITAWVGLYRALGGGWFERFQTIAQSNLPTEY